VKILFTYLFLFATALPQDSKVVFSFISFFGHRVRGFLREAGHERKLTCRNFIGWYISQPVSRFKIR